MAPLSNEDHVFKGWRLTRNLCVGISIAATQDHFHILYFFYFILETGLLAETTEVGNPVTTFSY